jgi:two-component system NtrC family sensor kinase
MQSEAQLREQVIELTLENKRLAHYKQINQLILRGLNTLLTLDNKQDIFLQFFDLLKDAVDFSQASILQLSPDQQVTVLASSLPVEPLTRVEQQQLRIFLPKEATKFDDVRTSPLWQKYFSARFPCCTSLLIQPFQTSRADYCLLLSDSSISAFDAGQQLLIEQFVGFAASTMDRIETRQLLHQTEALQLQHQQMRQSLIQSEKMASLGQLAAGVAHELNNPLGYLLSNISTFQAYLQTYNQMLQWYQQLTQLDPMTEAYRQLVDKIAEESQRQDLPYIISDSVDLINDSLEGAMRLRDIINSLRRFSHPDRGVMEQVSVNDILQSTVRMIFSEIKNKTTVQYHLAENLPPVLANPSQISQVFLNVVMNAAQAMTQKMGEIVITSRQAANQVQLQISDNAAGIAPEHLGRIFDPFFTTKDVGKGTGLGLSLCKAIVDEHGGTIEVQSEVGVGTTFLLTFPIFVPDNTAS